MTKFVILGSCRFEPYEILAVPEKVPGKWNTEEGYKIATEKFHPAMDEADVIIVFAPNIVGKHTQMDIDYATGIGKTVYALVPFGGKAMTPRQEYELARSIREKILIDHSVNAGSAMNLGIALDKMVSVVGRLEGKITELKRVAEPTEEFLLGREFDIANGESELGMLKDLFKTTFGREPRDAFRCPKCNAILKNIHYAIEDRYPFEGWRGRCPTCKKSVDVEDPE